MSTIDRQIVVVAEGRRRTLAHVCIDTKRFNVLIVSPAEFLIGPRGCSLEQRKSSNVNVVGIN